MVCNQYLELLTIFLLPKLSEKIAIYNMAAIHPLGYHQKCHAPPIPATALVLNTPWNCAYCLKGVKCPFLTESLDVLQNLLSEDEAASHDEVESVTTMDTDEGDEIFHQSNQTLSPPVKPAVVSPMKKKVIFLSC